MASHALFVTLDPIMRRVKLGDARQVLISDTVGFIDRLPHQLVAAFRATLEEVTAADLLVHVIDASVEDRERRTNAVRSVLAEVGATAVPTIEVFNKIDLLDRHELTGLKAAHPDSLFISATTAAGRATLIAAIAARLSMDAERLRFDLDQARESDRRLVADLYRHATVVSHEQRGERVEIEADVPRRLMSRFRRAQVPA